MSTFAMGHLRSSFLKEPSGELVGGAPGASRPSCIEEMDSAKSLMEVSVDALNGLREEAEEWQELEFMVDSGAGATVIGPYHARAVQASEPDTVTN